MNITMEEIKNILKERPVRIPHSTVQFLASALNICSLYGVNEIGVDDTQTVNFIKETRKAFNRAKNFNSTKRVQATYSRDELASIMEDDELEIPKIMRYQIGSILFDMNVKGVDSIITDDEELIRNLENLKQTQEGNSHKAKGDFSDIIANAVSKSENSYDINSNIIVEGLPDWLTLSMDNLLSILRKHDLHLDDTFIFTDDAKFEALDSSIVRNRTSSMKSISPIQYHTEVNAIVIIGELSELALSLVSSAIYNKCKILFIADADTVVDIENISMVR